MSNSGGPWVVGGTTYQYRTAAQTANGGLSAGSKTYSITMTDNDGNSGTDGGFTVTVDNSGPTVTNTVIQKNEGFTGGYIRQGGVYRVFANVSDPTGVGTVTANVTNITTGASSVALTTTGGPFTVDGVSYAYRSGTQTANNPLTAGSKSYSITATDGLGNSSTSNTGSVTVDNTVPTGTNYQTANGGGTAGQPGAGDTLTFTFSEPMEPDSFLAGWSGASTGVTVQIQQNANNDNLQVWNSANSAVLPFGTVSLGGNYMSGATRNFPGSTMVMSGNSITVTLGTPSAATQHRRCGDTGLDPVGQCSGPRVERVLDRKRRAGRLAQGQLLDRSVRLQTAARHLAQSGLRELIDQLKFARSPVARQRVAHVFPEFLQGGRIAGVDRDDPCDDPASPVLVRATGDRDLGHLRVRTHRGLDLRRPHLLPTGDDDLVHASEDPQSPVRSEIARVPRLQPPVRGEHGRRRAVVEAIAAHQRRTRELHASLRSDANRHPRQRDAPSYTMPPQLSVSPYVSITVAPASRERSRSSSGERLRRRRGSRGTRATSTP